LTVQTSSQERIDALTARGLWGTDTLHDLLAGWARRAPEQLAVADQPNRADLVGGAPLRLNFAQLDAASDALAADLLALGIGADDRVMLQLPNIAELVICYYAGSKLGAVLSPLPVQYGSHEIRSLAATLSPTAFITVPEFRGTALAEDAAASLPGIPVLAFGRELGVRAVDAVDAAARDAVAAHQRANPIDANRIFTICWTSGTTGTPKGVPRSHNMWLASGRMTAIGSGYQSGEILLNPFPMVNMSALGGFLYPGALTGCGIVLHHPLDPPLFLQQMQQEAVNFTIAPPALLNRLAHAPEMWRAFDFSALRAIGSGSAPLSPDMIATFERDYGVEIINIYGSNEGIALVSTPETAPDPTVRAALFPRSGGAGSSWKGPLHEGVATKVIDPDSGAEITGAGGLGELCFAGPTVFDGYLGHSDGGLFTADGYFRTGDLVEICGDPPDYYRIAGRCKDIINRGGMKISPSELDTLLESFPGLVEVAVAACPDEDLGEKICAFVVPDEGSAPPTLEAICEHLRNQGIARFKLPERIEVIDALPRNPLGKVIRHQLSEKLTRETT
jgi:acyl-CoA synthetase (AMP-forming)/AMP-acid ligase II